MINLIFVYISWLILTIKLKVLSYLILIICEVVELLFLNKGKETGYIFICNDHMFIINLWSIKCVYVVVYMDGY